MYMPVAIYNFPLPYLENTIVLLDKENGRRARRTACTVWIFSFNSVTLKMLSKKCRCKSHNRKVIFIVCNCFAWLCMLHEYKLKLSMITSDTFARSTMCLPDFSVAYVLWYYSGKAFVEETIKWVWLWLLIGWFLVFGKFFCQSGQPSCWLIRIVACSDHVRQIISCYICRRKLYGNAAECFELK